MAAPTEAPDWATAAILSARMAAAAASAAPMEIRVTPSTGGFAGAFATRDIEEGETLFQEHPRACALMASDDGSGAGLSLCAHCLSLAGGTAVQLQSVGATAGLAGEELEALAVLAPGTHAEKAPCGGCSDCGAQSLVTCSLPCALQVRTRVLCVFYSV